MRIGLKRDILNMVKTLRQAHDEIKNNITGKKYNLAQTLLNQCQECAISIGTTIEEFEGKNFITVSYIEEYCEELYHVYEKISNSSIDEKQICKTLNIHLLKVENSIQYDIVGKKEFIFLPYKASMWDSLESVWKAADEDPECDAYVIPIPYFDKNPDGSLRNEHYEGDKFPPEVPITHYERYDFKNRHPDAIFIHNPYDQYNYVTTVHPFFYTNKLKEYGEKLIYIPYYVSDEADPDSQAIMEDRAGYVLSNGVLHSDMVFVQSENTKKLFVNILEKNVSGVGRSYWENKIYGLGSPKFDRVNSVQRDDSKLSKQWKSIIYSSEGIRKQTIFYNVSVSTLLNHPDILDKIEDTLNYFRKHTELALWWRPHPLYESTLASMRPELLIKYKSIVTRYQKEAWGIFDDGVDLNWAIAETDAYYGDSSSVVHLYKEAQKPIMIQNVLVRIFSRIKAENIPIWPSSFLVEGNNLWFVHGKMNVLMRYDFAVKHTYIVAKIPNEKLFMESSYQIIYKWNNKIILIPCWARELSIYDIKSNKIEKILLKHIEKFQKKLLFCKAFQYNQYLYCIPYQYESILKIDMNSMNIEYVNITKIIEKHIINASNFLIGDATRIENKVVALFDQTNQLLLFDLITNKVQICSIGEKRQYSSLTSLNKTLYLYDKKDSLIIKWNRELYDEEELLISSHFENACINSFGEKYIVINNIFNNAFTIINQKGDTIYRKNEQYNISKYALSASYSKGLVSESDTNNVIYYFNTSENRLYQFCEECMNMTLSINEDEVNNIRDYLKKCDLQTELSENELCDMETWLELIKKMKKSINIYYESSGKQILKIVKNQ